MCIKNINANISCYKSISTLNDFIVSLNAPFSSLKMNENNYSIDDFVVLTQFNFLGTNNIESQKSNVLFNRDKIDIIIRLTKCDTNESKRLGIDLDKFIIDLNQAYKDKQVSTACFDFYNYTRITRIDSINIPSPGLYVIKVLIKTEKEEKYTIQAMNKLFIEK